jgi:hypothetical protein
MRAPDQVLLAVTIEVGAGMADAAPGSSGDGHADRESLHAAAVSDTPADPCKATQDIMAR